MKCRDEKKRKKSISRVTHSNTFPLIALSDWTPQSNVQLQCLKWGKIRRRPYQASVGNRDSKRDWTARNCEDQCLLYCKFGKGESDLMKQLLGCEKINNMHYETLD